MPVLREQLQTPTDPVFRLSAPSNEEPVPPDDAMTMSFGITVAASIYEAWAASDPCHMDVGERSSPRRASRDIDDEEFVSVVVAVVNRMLDTRSVALS